MSINPLDYDPFAGDFGYPDTVFFHDKIVKARKEHKCFHCGDQIKIGELYRSRAEKYEGEMRSWRWCAKCCEAMIKELNNQGSLKKFDSFEQEFPFEARGTYHHNRRPRR